jgi:phosphoglycerate dehydrogenase-like enzyme
LERILHKILDNTRLRGAALDVFSYEPPTGNLLLTLDNVIVTPHMGGYTFEALRETGMICARGIVDILERKQPQFIVNPEVLK